MKEKLLNENVFRMGNLKVRKNVRTRLRLGEEEAAGFRRRLLKGLFMKLRREFVENRSSRERVF
jgi:hypothetical protein